MQKPRRCFGGVVGSDLIPRVFGRWSVEVLPCCSVTHLVSLKRISCRGKKMVSQ